MKSKIKFNNRTQNYKRILKILLIVFIFGTCIYLLYFNDKIFVQSIIQAELNNESNNKSNIKESFDVNNYVDICKNRKTRFYNYQNTTPLRYVNIDTSNNCENECNTTPNCYAYVMPESISGVIDTSKCYLYTATLDASNIDRSSMSVDVNCNSTILPSDSYTYNGFGYVNKHYFTYNKSKFSYIDAYLDKGKDLINTIKYMNTNLESIRTNAIGDPQLVRNAEAATYNIGSWITGFGSLLGVNTSNLFTINSSTDLIQGNIVYNEKEKVLKNLHTISKDTPALENKLIDIKNNSYADNLFYTILAFIMVITIILLVIYRLDNNIIINDNFMIIYFIVIVSIFTLIHFILNSK